MNDLLLLFGAGLLAGAMNALAGGGSFVSLPAMIATGMGSVPANASSTVALWPGGAAGAWTYHQGFGPVCGVSLRWLAAVTLAGGLLGSLLLLLTPSSDFDVLLPWLLLVATVSLAFGRRLGEALRGRLRGRAAPVIAVQFGLGIYAGYFGGAAGLMMLAAWSMFGETDTRRLNGPRTLLISVANSVAVLAFIIAGVVRWPETIAMLAGGLIGGIVGARLGRILPLQVARVGTLCWTVAITTVFFVRAYGPR